MKHIDIGELHTQKQYKTNLKFASKMIQNIYYSEANIEDYKTEVDYIQNLLSDSKFKEFVVQKKEIIQSKLDIFDSYHEKIGTMSKNALNAHIHKYTKNKIKQETLTLLLCDNIFEKLISLRETCKRFAKKVQSSFGD